MATMKSKPKITRLGDPANPYTKKKVSAAEDAASYRAAGKGAVKPGVTRSDKPAKKKRKPTYESVRDRQIRNAGG